MFVFLLLALLTFGLLVGCDGMQAVPLGTAKKVTEKGKEKIGGYAFQQDKRLECGLSCRKPVKPKTEREYMQLKRGEQSSSETEMLEKLRKISSRRGEELRWTKREGKVRDGQPNILVMLVDDLGFGDLSVPPFVGNGVDQNWVDWLSRENQSYESIVGIRAEKDKNRTDIDWNVWPCFDQGGILTPNLERMAAEGIISTNFHAASPVCSPSRVSMLTGLYPHRAGALNAFELGWDLTQRNGFLPQIPTGPEILRGYGYYTGHSGKWHLGGMREEQRLSRALNDSCEWPGPNQHGFQDYISELDGPESPRYTFYMSGQNLHSKGSHHLITNDVPIPFPKKDTVLSDKEAEHAIEMIKTMTEQDREQPWYVQVWFNAPHGPWEVIPSGLDVYSKHYGKSTTYWETMTCQEKPLLEQRSFMYKTMVSAMDRSIGKILDTLRDLDIEKDTLVVFTSDNGPEQGAGNAGPYQERKRSLLEGGIRIPAIWKWPGKLSAGVESSDWGSIIDLFPTFLDAAGLEKLPNVHWDGISLWPALRAAKMTPEAINNSDVKKSWHNVKRRLQSKTNAVCKVQTSAEMLESVTRLHSLTHGDRDLHSVAVGQAPTHTNQSESGAYEEESDVILDYDKRIFLWHKDTEKPKPDQVGYQSSGQFDKVKITTNSVLGCLDRVYDHRHDPFEEFNLFTTTKKSCRLRFDTSPKDMPNALKESLNRTAFGEVYRASAPYLSGSDYGLECEEEYFEEFVNKVDLIWSKLVPFVKHGGHPMYEYMHKRFDKATCKVPVAAEITPIKFTT
jgi:arylsulfatase A